MAEDRKALSRWGGSEPLQMEGLWGNKGQVRTKHLIIAQRLGKGAGTGQGGSWLCSGVWTSPHQQVTGVYLHFKEALWKMMCVGRGGGAEWQP